MEGGRAPTYAVRDEKYTGHVAVSGLPRTHGQRGDGVALEARRTGDSTVSPPPPLGFVPRGSRRPRTRSPCGPSLSAWNGGPGDAALRQPSCRRAAPPAPAGRPRRGDVSRWGAERRRRPAPAAPADRLPARSVDGRSGRSSRGPGRSGPGPGPRTSRCAGTGWRGARTRPGDRPGRGTGPVGEGQAHAPGFEKSERATTDERRSPGRTDEQRRGRKRGPNGRPIPFRTAIVRAGDPPAPPPRPGTHRRAGPRPTRPRRRTPRERSASTYEPCRPGWGRRGLTARAPVARRAARG